MPALDSKSFDEPDDVVSLPLMRQHVVVIGEVHIARTEHHPGWRWSEHVKPVVRTPSCMHHHQGILVQGELEIETDTGARRRIHAGEAFNIPPGHDSRVVGDELTVTIEFTGVRGWARPDDARERIVATLLVTDIVGSTAAAVRLGDRAWKQLLARHGERVRRELDRFRGVEVTTTGDGFLVVFDGAARAVRCAAAIRRVAELDGLQVRAGVHSGEVERDGHDVRGVAVHAVTRIAALGEPGDVLVSASAENLLEGSDLAFEDAGEHELRGLPGLRRVYRLAGGELG